MHNSQSLEHICYKMFLQYRGNEIAVKYCFLIFQLNLNIVINCNIIKNCYACSIKINMQRTSEQFLIWRQSIITHIQILGDVSTAVDV